MGETPLYTALCRFAATEPLRLHMPGHHGKPLPGREMAGYSAIDFTELPPTGDLYEAGGPIEEAEHLWAEAYGMAHCLFLTGGSTQGNLAALTLACKPGDTILMDRGSHRSIYNALGLLDLRPVYLGRPWLTAGVTGPTQRTEVENCLRENPNIKTVCITSPTYYGVMSDIEGIAAAVHARGGLLVVDGAHGAHLPFLGENPYLSADLVVVSAHKTLPAPGQSALLLSGGAFSMAELRRAGALYGSSSPSYPMMAALDLCRAYMEEVGAELYTKIADSVDKLRRAFPSLTSRDAALDPTRFVLCTGEGFEVNRRLEAMGVYPEMADPGHVVFILTCADGEAELRRLTQALNAIGPTKPKAWTGPVPPEPPTQACTPRQALFSTRELLPVEEAEGRVAADQAAPYPPGIPIIAPGELVEKKHLSYLKQMGYNMKNKLGVL